MRHNKKFNHLGRKTAHRGAMLSNMANSLIIHKRIFTTVPKAKELRKFVEPIITKSKEDTTNSRRVVFSMLQSKEAVTELFQGVSQKVASRPGGYTRIIKTGNRLGDNASMCFIELVDYNENLLKETDAKKTRTRRSRRKSTTDDASDAAPKAEGTKVKTAPKTVEKTAADAPESNEAKDSKKIVVEEQTDNNDTPSGNDVADLENKTAEAPSSEEESVKE